MRRPQWLPQPSGSDLRGIRRSTGRLTRVRGEPRTRIDRALEDYLGRFGEVLGGDVIETRQALQKVLVDRVKFTPITLPDGQRTYRLEAELTLGRILTTEVHSKVDVPDGICTLLFPAFRLITAVKRAA